VVRFPTFAVVRFPYWRFCLPGTFSVLAAFRFLAAAATGSIESQISPSRGRRGQPRHDRAARKVKEKGEPELHEAVKRGRIGVQDAAKVADLPPEQQKAIAVSPKPRRAAAEAVVKNAVSRAGGAESRSERDRHAALRKAWDASKALRALWGTADDRTKEWFVGAVLLESEEAREAGPNWERN
jgi:hypothetical protein